MKEFTPNAVGLALFLFLLVSFWLLVRFLLTEYFGDGDMVRFGGLLFAVVTLRPLWKAFEKYLFYIYD